MTRFTPLWQQDGEYAATEDRRLIGALWPAPAVIGFTVSPAGGGFFLNVAAGAAAIPTPNATGSVLCTSDAVEEIELNAPPGSGGTQNRIDVVAIQLEGTEIGMAGDPGFDYIVITGTFAGAPVAPAIPPGCFGLAQVYVGNGVATIAPGNITDIRPAQQLAVASRIPHSSGAANSGATLSWIQNGWQPWPPGPGLSIPFTKYRSDTVLKVECATTAYGSPTGNQGARAQLGFRIGTTVDRPVGAQFIAGDALQPRHTIVGGIVVPGIAAGALTVNMRANWPGAVAGHSLNFGPNEFATITVTEEYA